MKSVLKASGTQRLKLRSHEPRSSFASKFQLAAPRHGPPNWLPTSFNGAECDSDVNGDIYFGSVSAAVKKSLKLAGLFNGKRYLPRSCMNARNEALWNAWKGGADRSVQARFKSA
jgi:hypothetical protein